ncbi:hypothetical protein ACWIUD_07820 [Helicobacter sp. 23-1044]
MPQIDFIMFDFLIERKENAAFEKLDFIDCDAIIDNRAFYAKYFCQNGGYFNLATKCVQKDIFLKAINLVRVDRKLIVAEDILASMAILCVSETIATLNSGLYYYALNEKSIMNDSAKLQTRIENLHFVISKVSELSTKKDRQYEIFMKGLALVLEGHITSNKLMPLISKYKERLNRGYPKFLARLLLSLSKKPLKIKQKERALKEFEKAHKGEFDKK